MIFQNTLISQFGIQITNTLYNNQIQDVKSIFLHITTILNLQFLNASMYSYKVMNLVSRKS